MYAYINLLRPHQWIKNLLLFFPPFFGGSIVSLDVADKIFPVFISFCSIASSNYIVNDIADIEADRNHQSKKDRALASGAVSVKSASFTAILLLIFSFFISFKVSDYFWIYLLSYLFISLSYTFFLKNLVIFDIFFISFGFLIRVMAGGEAFAVAVSNWLFMTVFLVAFFLATGKRLGELVSMGGNAFSHRKSLAGYNKSFLEGMLWFSASSALITYALYTLEHGSILFYTVPLAAFGLLRYIYIASDGMGDPTEALFKDPQIMGVGILWAVVIAAVVYG